MPMTSPLLNGRSAYVPSRNKHANARKQHSQSAAAASQAAGHGSVEHPAGVAWRGGAGAGAGAGAGGVAAAASGPGDPRVSAARRRRLVKAAPVNVTPESLVTSELTELVADIDEELDLARRAASKYRTR